MIDAYSKWLEAVYMRDNTKAGNLIKKTREICSCLGIPVVCTSDNGPQLVSDQFETFLSTNGVKHITNSTYSPAFNSIAQSLMGKFNVAMRIVIRDVDQ